MINNIILKNVATFEKNVDTIIKPSKVNFIYGNNGTGKTTITRVIENPNKYKDSKLSWDNNIEYSRLVYNQDFVKSNFNPETKLRGIYTLGEGSEEIYKKIEKLTNEKKEISNNKETKNEELTKKKDSLKNYKQSIEDLFWNTYKKNYCDKVIELYRGSINKKEIFLDKCLSIEELDDNISFEDILEEYKTLYENELKEQKLIEKIDTDKFKQIITSDILTTMIIENKDITLSQLIEDLDNSKWVEEGIKYLEKSENRCPSIAFLIASGTSDAFPFPTPTCPFSSPTTTTALNLNVLPPFTTFATLLIATTFSFNSDVFSAKSDMYKVNSGLYCRTTIIITNAVSPIPIILIISIFFLS